MSAALILVTLTLCVLMYLVHSLVLVTVDIQEMDLHVKVMKYFLICCMLNHGELDFRH